MVQLRIKHGRGFTVDVGEDATIVDVKFAVFEKNKKVTCLYPWISVEYIFHFVSDDIFSWSFWLYWQVSVPQLYPSRQRLTLVEDTKKRLSDDTKLSDALDGQLKDGVELKLKDLGPQVNWKTVFLVEYVRDDPPLDNTFTLLFSLVHWSSIPFSIIFQSFGSARIFNTVHCKSNVFYSSKHVPHIRISPLRYIYAFIMIHFTKRELETLLCVDMTSLFRISHIPSYSIHRFSHSTMHVYHIFKKCVIVEASFPLLTSLLAARFTTTYPRVFFSLLTSTATSTRRRHLTSWTRYATMNVSYGLVHVYWL